MNPDTVVRCIDLKKQYPGVLAVAGVELEIKRGECFGLLGPNGAGKTTTIEILEGLTTPDSGTVEVLGRTWGKDDLEIRQRIGVQLQDSQLGDKLTVREILVLFRSLYVNGRDPEELLSMFELKSKADSHFVKLSGGQKQRVILACALVSDPELLFLDEPTTGLDPQARMKVWEVVRAYQQRGGSVLMTTHYMEEAAQLCDRLAIMDAGKVIALGTPRQLIDSLEAKQIIEFELAAELDLPLIEAALGDAPVTVQGALYRVSATSVSETLPALLRALERAGAALVTLRTFQPTLDDVFLAKTGKALRDD